eukprot:1695211-Rhodomonas_salina.1
MDAGVGGREQGSAHGGAEAEWIHVTVPRHSAAHASRAVPVQAPVVSVPAGLAGRPSLPHPFIPGPRGTPTPSLPRGRPAPSLSSPVLPLSSKPQTAPATAEEWERGESGESLWGGGGRKPGGDRDAPAAAPPRHPQPPPPSACAAQRQSTGRRG